ncbi:hypothetical protein Tco_1440170 [Tanacetum coccineum]
MNRALAREKEVQDRWAVFELVEADDMDVTPKTSHLNDVKRIFKYLKGKPNLGLWYPRESSFDLEAFLDSYYVGANLDRKSTTGGCQFLRSRLISWQCKKQTILATSTIEAEYIAAASCCGQVLWIQNQMLDYGFNFMNTKIHIDNESTICIVKNPVYHSKTKHIEIRHHFIRDSYEKKLIRVEKIHTDFIVANLLTKAFDGPRFHFLVVNIDAYLIVETDASDIGYGGILKQRLEDSKTEALVSRESKKDSNHSEQRTNVRYNSKVQEGYQGAKVSGVGKSYVNVVQGTVSKGDSGNSPAIVLDDDCGNDIDLSRQVFGKVKDFNSINNLKLILAKEGFEEVKLSYLGGLWVMIELHNVETQKNLLTHSGDKSWFHELSVQMLIFSRGGTIVVRKVPWTLKESTGSLFSRKRLCIKTCLPINILELFKVIFKGKIFMVRAKELFMWSPCFSDFKVDDYSSDKEPEVGDLRKPVMPMDDMEKVVNDSDEEVVSESSFETGPDLNCIINKGDGIIQAEVQNFVDPFGIYDILNKNTVKNVIPDPSLSHPPDLTAIHPLRHPWLERARVKEMSPIKQNGDTRIDDSNVNTSESINDFSPNIPSRKTSKGGSMLDVLDDLIKVGKSMGYVKEGCSKDFDTHHTVLKEFGDVLNKILLSMCKETKMDCIYDMDIKFMSGNSNFQYIASDSVGNSGGLLCVWEKSIFKKSGASVSDNFIALYGTWLPTSTKILIVVIMPSSLILANDYVE